ncbi:MAG: response regulator [Gammaproteobacteria bacterium]|nr:response regulator [Gammaproteobacteria bacterium]
MIAEQKHQYTVLYIEDNPANLRLVVQLLGRRPDIQMLTAIEPLQGLELAAIHKPDLILLDINLPGIDGYEVLKRLRQREATQDKPVIAISANALLKDIKKGLQAGFDDYITKPININLLLQAVDNRLLKNGK